MDNRLIHMLIGQNPPLLVRNLVRHTKTVCRRPIETECARFCIPRSDFVDSFVIKGLISNRDCAIPIDITPGRTFTTHSCFDYLHLFFYYVPRFGSSTDLNLKDRREFPDLPFMNDGQCHVFYSKICCCGNWDTASISAKEIEITGKGEISIPIHITNARKATDYHYNTSYGPEDDYSAALEMLSKHRCQFCFKIFRLQADLDNHISFLHSIYSRGDVVFVPRVREPPRQDESLPLSLQGIEFYSQELFDECSRQDTENSSFIDFCEELAVGNIDTPLEYESTVPDPMVMKEKMGKCSKVASARRLVSSVLNEKCTERKEGINTHVLVVKPLIISDTKASHCSIKIQNPVLTDMLGVNDRFEAKPKILFLRRRETKLIEYTLANYGLLIEREFDTLDYSKILAKHLNLGLKDHLLEDALTPKGYKLMKTWNALFVSTSDVKASLGELISSYGLGDDIIEFIDLLYCRGILSSQEIVKVLRKCT